MALFIWQQAFIVDLSYNSTYNQQHETNQLYLPEALQSTYGDPKL